MAARRTITPAASAVAVPPVTPVSVFTPTNWIAMSLAEPFSVASIFAPLRETVNVTASSPFWFGTVREIVAPSASSYTRKVVPTV
ncbi:MAG: hypothetical protein BWX86_02565 [Verrucomicrobia bacterium ADurb.Bin122]|nr:MAG: hypothetical protein BWX86_02565 [Verrucomicrobia bacterium ADurb.Bin122]